MAVQTLQSFTNNREKREKLLKNSAQQEGSPTHAYDAVERRIRLIRKIGRRASESDSNARYIDYDGFPFGELFRLNRHRTRQRAKQAFLQFFVLFAPTNG